MEATDWRRGPLPGAERGRPQRGGAGRSGGRAGPWPRIRRFAAGAGDRKGDRLPGWQGPGLRGGAHSRAGRAGRQRHRGLHDDILGAPGGQGARFHPRVCLFARRVCLFAMASRVRIFSWSCAFVREPRYKPTATGADRSCKFSGPHVSRRRRPRRTTQVRATPRLPASGRRPARGIRAGPAVLGHGVRRRLDGLKSLRARHAMPCLLGTPRDVRTAQAVPGEGSRLSPRLDRIFSGERFIRFSANETHLQCDFDAEQVYLRRQPTDFKVKEVKTKPKPQTPKHPYRDPETFKPKPYAPTPKILR